MKIIAGLGNPGFRYRNTRHNAGFMAVSVLSKRYGIPLKKRGYNGVYGVGRMEGEEVLLFEPRTYMNLSGEAVKAVCSSRLEEQRDLLVVSDDVNLELGYLRLREKGSAGGHNGLRSIIGHLGEDFARLRIGVGREEAMGDLAAYVLAPFRRSERSVLAHSIENAADCARIWLINGPKEAMNEYNRPQ